MGKQLKASVERAEEPFGGMVLGPIAQLEEATEQGQNEKRQRSP